MSDTHAGCFSIFKSFVPKRFATGQSSGDSKETKNSNDANIECSEVPHACDIAFDPFEIWDDQAPPPGYPAHDLTQDIYRPEVLATIEDEINRLDRELRHLNLQIHDHPELRFEEKFAHDTLTAFMSSHGFSVTKHYLGFDTAWRATFSHGTGGRVIGVNSEMDALPHVGHACGRNLIAMIGVAISLGIKAAFEKHNISGKIVLLGTPGDEGGGGKIMLIDRGAFEEMDACVMAHPGTGPAHSAGTGPSKAAQRIHAEFIGHSAHASAAPWEGRNALDATVIAYSSVALLRQQIKPSHRVHGVMEPEVWTPSMIPEKAKMTWIVRAPTKKEAEILRERVINCLKGAALASNTECRIDNGFMRYDLSQNEIFAQNFTRTVSKYNVQVSPHVEGGIGGSTEFGNVTHKLPALHPSFAIPTKPNGGNHTALFAAAARTEEAHSAALVIARALAHTGFRVVEDDEFFKKAKAAFTKARAEE